jgi:hypothetical protein
LGHRIHGGLQPVHGRSHREAARAELLSQPSRLGADRFGALQQARGSWLDVARHGGFPSCKEAGAQSRLSAGHASSTSIMAGTSIMAAHDEISKSRSHE